MKIDDRGRIVWTPKASDLSAAYPITITVTDAQGAVTTQAFTLTTKPDTEKPKVNLIATQNLVERGSSVTLIATATDNTAIANLGLVVNGQAVMLDANGRATLTFNDAGVINAIATATDIAGNSNSADTTIDVVDLSAPFNPNLTLDLPDVVTAPVKFDVGGNGVVGYKVEAISLADGTTRTLTEKRGAIALNEQATFDPTLLENGAYTVRVTFDGANGSSTFVEDTVSVEGELKLGNFRLSFTDLVVPVSGIPITLTRTYDSLTADRSADFGYGWRMEFRDTRLTTSLGPDKLYQEYGLRSNAFDRDTKVYITLPGGKREAFQFAPIGDPVNQFIPSVTSTTKFYIPAFKALNGSTNTLQLKSKSSDELPSGLNRTKWLNEGPDGKFREVGNPFDPANPFLGLEYVLTTKDGTAYIIDPTSGKLTEVRDPNGNRIIYTDDAITSSTGQKVTFERDADGRIVSVADPLGEVIRYTYDASGDLVSVTDREKNVARMVYDTSYDDPNFAGTDDAGRLKRSHFLREIIDPLGRVGARSEYGEDGRLKQIVDASGKAVEMTYDLGNDRQVVKDQLGNETVYVYDDRGNIVQELDAVGKLTKRTFDAKNNLLSETFITLETGASGYTTSYTYDDRGNQLTRTNAMGETDIYTYNSRRQLLTSTNALGHTTMYTYDSRGNLLTKADAKKHVISFEYDLAGNLTSMTEGENDVTRFEYDRFGNRIREIDALGNVKEFKYDLSGNVLQQITTLTTPNGKRTLISTKTYDTEGRVTSLLDAAGNRTEFKFDAAGNQTSVVDALNRRTEYHYDALNQLVRTVYPDNTPDDPLDNLRVDSTYDAAGNRTSFSDSLNRASIFKYDQLNRATEVL
jgi:YD repeat-containing protein